MINIGQKLKEIRSETPFTPYDVAIFTGHYFTGNKILFIESGASKPSSFELKMLCTFYKIEVSELIKGTDYEA